MFVLKQLLYGGKLATLISYISNFVTFFFQNTIQNYRYIRNKQCTIYVTKEPN